MPTLMISPASNISALWRLLYLVAILSRTIAPRAVTSTWILFRILASTYIS